MSLTPIETSYNGYRFRSRLEARWAVFFDAMGISYQYEPQGFSLPSGAYLPDFWLPEIGCWVEIKGEYETSEECQLCAELAKASGHPVYIMCGGIPANAQVYPCESGHVLFPGIEGGWDCPHQFAACPECGSVGIGFSGYLDRITHRSGCSHSGHCGDDERIERAFQAARSARFEHGETPHTEA